MSALASSNREDAPACYHCGLPVPPGFDCSVAIGGVARPMCCPGCEAVAQAIVDAGCEHYYDKRDRYPDSPREALPEAVADLAVFDREEVQAGFVTAPAGHEREASLILEGITCPACIWLNERHLARQPGVTAVHINYSTRRARVRWDTRETALSAILAAIRAIGYRAYPYDAQSLEALQKREARGLLARFAVAGLGMMQVMMYAWPGYVAGVGDLPSDVDQLMRWASLVLTLPVVLYSSTPFFAAARRDLLARRVGMDVPVALAIVIAFVASAWATVSGHGAVYFDSVAMFVCLLLGARYLELRARQKAAAHLESLSRAVPATAARLRDFPLSLAFDTVPAGVLEAGDRVLVRPGDAFPADGVLEQGDTEADESLLTGESLPVRRRQGERVLGGAVNRGDPVVVRVDRTGEQTLLSSIVRLMERAAQARPRLQVVTDRVAAYLVAGVLAVAALTAAGWLWVDAARALPIVVAVLIGACVWELAVARPMALAVATARAAREGLLATRAHALETLARATHVVLDKTGTLTRGRPSLVDVGLMRGSREMALAYAAALERGSEHPLARAVEESVAAGPMASRVRNFPGLGIEGWVDGRRLRIGAGAFVAELSGGAESAGEQGEVCLGDEHGLIAELRFADSLRPDAVSFVHALQRGGVKVILLSGDRSPAVRATARALGIGAWHAGVPAEGKQACVAGPQAEGALVAMIGDGVNDAPVLAQAQVSVAMMSGAALAQGAADMVLLSGRLNDLAEGVVHARRTLRVVRENLGWAIAYNAVAIPLAVVGLVTPWLAAIGMSASSTIVVLNALRLAGRGKRWKKLVPSSEVRVPSENPLRGNAISRVNPLDSSR